MTAWFLCFILTFGSDGSPETGLKIDNYKDQLTCEAAKTKAIDQEWYPLLICIEKPVIET